MRRRRKWGLHNARALLCVSVHLSGSEEQRHYHLVCKLLKSFAFRGSSRVPYCTGVATASAAKSSIRRKRRRGGQEFGEKRSCQLVVEVKHFFFLYSLSLCSLSLLNFFLPFFHFLLLKWCGSHQAHTSVCVCACACPSCASLQPEQLLKFNLNLNLLREGATELGTHWRRRGGISSDDSCRPAANSLLG